MATLFGTAYTRDELTRRFGDTSQLGGITLATLEGGVRAALFNTGSGFRYTVLLDRAMDVSSADHCGRSLCWRSTVGDKPPAFFEPDGFGWLRTFFGGLVATCGLTYHGAPGTDEDEAMGLHGRITVVPAANVALRQGWVGNEYEMALTGQMRETSIANIPTGKNIGHNLLLTRTISTALGRDSFTIHDHVENQGFNDAPFMILYHINAGFPALDEGSRLYAPVIKSTPRDADAEEDAANYDRFHAPREGYREKCYFLDMQSDPDGSVRAALANPNLDEGFGLYVKYNKEELPYFTEWKMLCAGTYSVGLEPGNSYPQGRAKERAEGRLTFLKPGETRAMTLEIGAITDLAQVESP